MSVLKLSKNDIIRNEDKEEKIKLKRSDLSYDSARVSGWEQTNRQSLDIINNYNNRINKSEWLSKEDRETYKKALDSYIETANLLRGINKTFGEGYTDEDEKSWLDSIASMNSAYDSTEKYYSQWIDEKDYKGQRDGWFQKSNQFDDGYQFGDVLKTVAGSATDIVENLGAGIIGMGEAALDALVTLGPYFAQGQYYANGGGYNLQADQAFDQSTKVSKEGASDFVKKDLYNEQEVAKAIIADPVKALTSIDAETDSVFGEKTDSLAQSAGQLVGTAGLQAVGVPWWLTTGATALGGESQNALNQGATLDQAAVSGMVSAGAEILTEKIAGGISFGGKTLDDFLPSLTANISNKVVRNLLDLGIDMVGEGAEEVLSGVMSAIGQKMTYASEKEISELFSSEEALDSLIGGAVLGLGGGVIGSIGDTISENKQALDIYGNGADLVAEALDIDANNAYAQKMQTKLDSGKSLSGGQINRLVEANENALVSQDKGKMKAAVESRLTELGENGDVSSLADVIVKAQSGAKLTSSERTMLVNSKYGRRVSTELNPRSIESGEYSSKWAENIGTERINAEAYNRGAEAYVEQAETAPVGVNAPVKENTVGGKISAPTGKANQPVVMESNFKTSGDGKTKLGDTEVSIKEIASVKNGDVTLRLEDGSTVSASDVEFGSSEEGLLYENVVHMGLNAATANAFINNYDGNIPVAEYAIDFRQAYRYGELGVPSSVMTSSGYTSSLSEAQKRLAYELGKTDAKYRIDKKQAKIDSSKADKTGQKAKKGRVYFDGSVAGKTLTERQRASLKGLQVVAEATGVDIHVFESKVVNGKRQGANGWYDPGKKEIHLDLHAGIDGNGLMLFTASHELTHHIREVAPAKFKVFADALLEEYTKSGQSIDELIKRKLETLEANKRLDGKTESEAYDLAYEEVVADAAESMLVDSNAIEALSKKLQAKDKGLWETIKDFIAKLVNRIKAAYEGIDPDSKEGKLVREMKDSAERLQKLWVDALLEASAVNTVLGENGIIVASKTDSASLMSVRDVLSDADRKKVSKTLAERFGVTQAEAMDWLTAETSLASLILNPKYSQYLDYTADANEEAIKSNSDYPQGTVDFSNICKKRRDFTEVMNRVLRNFPNHVFAATDLAKIRTIMEQEGMEVACAICYVEDRRQLDSVVAQDFIDSLAIYREGGKNRPDGKPFNANQLKAFSLIEGDTYTPSIYELISLEGRNSLKAKNPAMEEAWVKFNNARGMQSVRLLLNDAEYKRQILKYTPAVVKRKNDYGGLRIYSFSDAEMFHLIDIIQVITDSATVGLSLQGYTKVNEYAKAVKDTGEKLNRSLIPKGDLGYHMENGRVVLDFDTVEGIDINHPDFFDNINNPNVGNIIIGINATQIKAAMTSKFIDQIIPFHTGQSGEVLGEKGIAAWDNYKDFQSERDASTKKKSSHQINIYTEVINAAEAEGHPITNKVEFVNKFLEVCKENNLIPRFSDFLNVDENGDYVYTEGYHKFLVDFKTFDQNTGEYLPQMPVKPIFDNEYITKLLTDYVKSQQTKDAELKKAMPKVLDRITKEIVKSDGVKYSDRNPYSYEALTGKPDMKLTTVGGNVPTNRADIVAEAKKNAAKMGKFNPKDGSVSVRVEDIGVDVILGKDGLKHSLDRRVGENAPVVVKAGEIISNSIRINELNPRKAEVDESYVLIGAAKDANGELYIVRSVVNRLSNELTTMDVLYAINAKKENRLRSMRPRFQHLVTDSTISIAQLLDFVNSYFPDILPESVLRHYGHTERPKGELGKSALYSDRNNIGYHAGDLGKAEWLHQQGYYRGTGHFGTGTYFVGDEARISGDNTYGKRPHHAVDFSDYNLYKVRNDKDGYDLHEQLRVIDGGISQEWLDTAEKNQFSLVSMVDVYDLAEERFGEDKYSQEAMESAIHELAKKHGIELLSRGEYSKKHDIPLSDEDFLFYYVDDYLRRTFKEAAEKVDSAYRDFRDAHFSLKLRFGYGATRQALQKVIDYQNANADTRWYPDKKDSLATVFMKALGYEGIDVRGTGLDNTAFGSVIYDLKDDTVLYQDRNPDSYSNRSLLAGALETAVQNDVEREKLKQYKQKIDLINAEEQKLHDLREQIKELSFKKGPRDTEAIRKLQFEANQAANRINTYDRQLLNLESTKALKGVLEREKAQARKRDAQKYKEALERYREKSAKTQRELMDRYQESRKRGVESRNKTAMRHKIKEVVNDLNNYLLKGTKDKHVPIELQKAVAEALDAVNMDTVGAEERIAKLKSEMMRARTPEAVQDIAKKIEHIEEMGGNMAKKISRLKTAYDSIINSDDPLVANSHDEVISSSIERVMEYVGDTALRDMSLSQLEEVYDMYNMVLFSIRNANKAFKAKKSEEISVIANRVMEEVDKLGKKKLQSKAGQTISEFDWNNQKPVYAFERIGSDTFTEVFDNVRAGEDAWAQDMTEAQEFREAEYKKHKYDSWDFKKRYAFTSSSGMKFELTIPQIMSLYAYSKREQAAEHLKRGGIVFDETTEVTVKNKLGIPVKFNPTEATAYNISEETLASIISKLTNEQKAFVDEMQDYLSSTMGEKGNEVSLELYGVKLFKEKNYFPLKSATQFMAKAKEQQKGEVKIKNSGFTKETVKKANNPIVLTPFMDVWAGHVNEMSMYHAFTLALEDFYRVYNYKTPTSETMATESVEMFLQNAHGKGATKYIDQLLKDLNGGARVDSTAGIINKLTGLFKKSAVFASLSVVVQQPSAIARATALVDTKYFVGTPSGKKHSETWAEVKKYAPVAVIKEMGYFDTGMGKSSTEWLKGEKTLMDKVDDIASKAPALADEYAWCAIWNAVKRETLHNNTDLKPTSEEFLNLVGERFTEVVTKTQVYDSVLSRSANMRSKDTGMKMATAFMGEPTTSLNMLENALIQGKRGNKKYAAKAIGGVISSMILNSILVSIVYAGRDDDEEKTYAEKYISTVTEELLDSFNPLTLVPFVKDIVSIVQGYDIERSDMAVITDLINAWNNLDSDNRSVYRKVEDFGGAIASIFGLPVKNVMRDVRGIYNTVNSFINGEKTTGTGIGSAIEEAVTGKEKSNGQQLYEAVVKGDSAQIERIKGRFEDEKAIDAAIRKALRENDPRIKEAAEAYLEGDYATYNSLRAKIVSEGIFSNQLVTDALKAEYNYLKKKANEDQ